MYKPTVEELHELGFSNEHGTDENHYMVETAKVNSFGFVLPQMMNYFADKNVFLLGAVFYFRPDSYDELKVILKAFSYRENADKHELENENS